VLNRLRAEKIKMRIFAEMLLQMSKILPYFVQIDWKSDKFHPAVTLSARCISKLALKNKS
jgi:hypothetical protein